MIRRPRLLLLPDVRNWAFHTTANTIAEHCADIFDIDIYFTHEKPTLHGPYDIIHVFYPFETHHRNFDIGNAKCITSVCSHRWEKEMDTYKFADKHLSQFDAVAVINIQLLSMLYDLHPHVFLCPDGINTKMFDRTDVRSGPMVVGWAGNTNDSIKQLPLLQKACEGICELRIASGDLDVNAMVRFYNTIDVIVCCSETEGGPRTLAEGMSCGNFPVSFNVGIAPEIIEHETNGLLVEEKSIEGLRSALLWCQNNIASVRGHWRVNREYIRSQRDKCHTTKQMAHMYQHVLSST